MPTRVLVILLSSLLASSPAGAVAAREALAHAKPPASAEPPASTAESERETAEKALCDLIETSAENNGLPVEFFTRLLWKESRFRGEAVSPKGAQGIAQFMPGTAAERGLDDPFDVSAAIPASATFLAELKTRFGNLGLAAAAYNAGPERVSSWLADASSLPYETQDYVLAITGSSAEIWADPEGEPPAAAQPDKGGCLELTALLRTAPASLEPAIETSHAPWGVQVAGNFSKAKAVDAYSRLRRRFPAAVPDSPPMLVRGRAPGRGARAFYRVRIPVETRSAGEALCARLRAAGGDCVVLKT